MPGIKPRLGVTRAIYVGATWKPKHARAAAPYCRSLKTRVFLGAGAKCRGSAAVAGPGVPSCVTPRSSGSSGRVIYVQLSSPEPPGHGPYVKSKCLQLPRTSQGVQVGDYMYCRELPRGVIYVYWTFPRPPKDKINL